MSAAAIAKRAARAIDTKSTVRVQGAVKGDGQTVTFDLVTRNFTDGVCTLSADGMTAEVIRFGGNDYVKADAKFWRMLNLPAVSTDAAATRADGKYVRVSVTSSDLANLTKFMNIPRIVWEELREDPDFVKSDSRTVNGVPTIAITSSELGKIYVATQGEPYVIRVEDPGGVSTGFTDFSDYLKPVDIKAPPADQVIDISTLATG